jgi:hypothetical protein
LPISRFAARLALTVTFICAGFSASGQSLPAGPVTAFGGRVVVSGDITAAAGERDDTAYFNYTDYEHNALRLFRVGATAVWRPADQLAFLAEVRSENLERPEFYAAFLRVRPWRSRAFSIQAGRIPPSFGAFARRTYAATNPLVGYPLAYQYLSPLRPDAIPATPDDLLRMRGRGWLAKFPVGSEYASSGLPVMSAFRWDTGIQATWDGGVVQLSGAVTTGTLSDPRTSDNNDGKQLSGRVAVKPVTGLVLAASASRGEWLSSTVTHLLPQQLSSDSHPQTAFGADAEYSRGYWIVQAEIIASRWRVPFSSPVPVKRDLQAVGGWVEGRYRFTPRIFAAARVDHLGFSRITGTLFSGQPTTWDAPVTRVEWGGGYYLQRNLIARLVVQHNRRDGGRVHDRSYVSAQLSYWF